MGNNIQSSASCPSNPSHKMSGTSKVLHNRGGGPPIISMNSVEESASPTKACSDHDNDDLSKSSTHHQYGPFVASYSNLEQRDTVIEKLFTWCPNKFWMKTFLQKILNSREIRILKISQKISSN